MKAVIIEEIRKALVESSTVENATSFSRFYKEGEEALLYGVKSSKIAEIVKQFSPQIKALPKADVLAICESLWQSSYLEEAIIACRFSESLKKKYEISDFKIFEHWVSNYVNNWADCDTLCTQTIGTFIMLYPEYIEELKNWAKSSNRWLRRASAVSLILPARKGMFLDEIFSICNILLLDQDDLVQKGYGWLLKVASKSYEHEVFDYVFSHKEVMPRTAYRYAIEKMSPALKREAMRK